MSEPNWIAQLDQMLAGLADMALVLGSYQKALVEQGFSDDQALVLTAGFQAHLLTSEDVE